MAYIPYPKGIGVLRHSYKKIYTEIVQLINDIQRHPFSGTGKPEPLKYQLKGLWSRHITDEHRLVYKIANEEIIIVSCRFHYY